MNPPTVDPRDDGERPGDGVRLADLTTLRLGGPTRRLVTVDTDEHLVSVVREADERGEPVLLLGGGSNVVVADSGWPGVTVLVRTRGIAIEAHSDGVEVTAAAGENWADLVAETVSRDLAGVEALAGIPGLVGATPIQNVGAYGQEISQVVRRVKVWDRRRGEELALGGEECGFDYRSSRFKRQPERYLVLAVTLLLRPSAKSLPIRYAELARELGIGTGDTAPLSATRNAVLTVRRRKGMVLDPADHDTWSAGSFFTNPIVTAELAADLPSTAPTFPTPRGTKVSAAWLIEQAGFPPGYGAGEVGLSTKHSLALVNRGAATTEDLLALAREIRDGVAARFGVELVPEPGMIRCRL